MTRQRAHNRCPVCKRPSVQSIHPSCAKRRTQARRRLATSPRKELRRRRRRRIRNAKQWAADKAWSAAGWPIRRTRMLPGNTARKAKRAARSQWVRSEGSTPITIRPQAQLPPRTLYDGNNETLTYSPATNTAEDYAHGRAVDKYLQSEATHGGKPATIAVDGADYRVTRRRPDQSGQAHYDVRRVAPDEHR